MWILCGYISTILYVLCCVLTGEILYKKIGIRPIYSRKIVHILLFGVLPVALYYFDISIHLVVITILCVLTNFLLAKFKFVKSIEFEDSTNWGTFVWAVSVFILALGIYCGILNLNYTKTAFICLCFGDGFAAVLGSLFKENNPKLFNKKSSFGTMAMFCSSFIVLVICNYLYNMKFPLYFLMSVAALGALIELYSPSIIENFSIPFIIVVYLTNFSFVFNHEAIQLTLIGSLVCALIFLPQETLTPAAYLTSICFLLIVSWSIGYTGVIYTVLLYVIIFIVELGKRKLIKIQQDNKKHKNEKTTQQIVCQGAIGIICAVLFFLTKHKMFCIGYFICCAAGFADTIASEIGVISKKPPRDICTFKTITKGQSGGVSFLGSASALIAIGLSAGLYVLLNKDFSFLGIGSILIIATICNIMDSVIGSRLQVLYKCNVCGKISEISECCGTDGTKIKGFGWINNRVTNLLMEIIGLLCIVITYFII